MQTSRTVGSSATLGQMPNRQGQNAVLGDDDADDDRAELNVEDYPKRKVASGHGCCGAHDGGEFTPAGMVCAGQPATVKCQVFPVVRSTGAFRA